MVDFKFETGTKFNLIKVWRDNSNIPQSAACSSFYGSWRLLVAQKEAPIMALENSGAVANLPSRVVEIRY